MFHKILTSRGKCGSHNAPGMLVLQHMPGNALPPALANALLLQYFFFMEFTGSQAWASYLAQRVQEPWEARSRFMVRSDPLREL